MIPDNASLEGGDNVNINILYSKLASFWEMLSYTIKKLWKKKMNTIDGIKHVFFFIRNYNFSSVK